MPRRIDDTPPDDEALAVSALAWLAQEPDLMTRFMALSGLTAEGLRAASSEPGFLAGVLAFILNHEPTLIAFASASHQRPEAIAAAGRRLSGDGHSDDAWSV